MCLMPYVNNKVADQPAHSRCLISAFIHIFSWRGSCITSLGVGRGRGRVHVFFPADLGERGGSVVECRTPEREVRGSILTAAVLCP